jgi:hypothetical protein
MCCVGNDDDLREVTIGKSGAFSKISRGSIFVDHTTVSTNVTKELFDIGSEMDLILLTLLFLVAKQEQKMECFQLCVGEISRLLTKQNLS